MYLRRAANILINSGLAICTCVAATAQQSHLPGESSVSGTQLFRDGQSWIPHGFFQIAFAVPPAAFDLTLNGKPLNPAFRNAYANYSPAEYEEMKNAGADSVRINVAQDGVDPDDNRYFDQQWANGVIGAVRSARNAGLTVILSIQNEKQTGSDGATLPNKSTLRVWRELAPLFGKDRGVMYELYNEPGIPQATVPARDQWRAWAGAMNPVVKLIRGLGATNVLVADGLALAQQLTGAPALDDPLSQVVYASHPYPHNPEGEDSAIWDIKFGNFAATAPVIVTEWGPGYYCDAATPNATVKFLSYLQQHRIGLEVVAWDWGPYNFASAVQGFPQPTFSSLLVSTGPNACTMANGNRPGVAHDPASAFGPGKVIESWYRTGVVPDRPK